MKKLIITILLSGFLAGLLGACAGGGGGNVTFRSHYGYGGWSGHRTYIDRRPIVVVPPGGGGIDGPEAVHLPESPPDFDMPEAEPMMDMDMDMDMGMPEIDID